MVFLTFSLFLIPRRQQCKLFTFIAHRKAHPLRPAAVHHWSPLGDAGALAAAARGMTGRGAGHGGAQAARTVHIRAAAGSRWAVVRARPRLPSSEAGGAGGEGSGPAGAMFVARSIAADHKDLIHDVSFDFHGRRMATCSSDQSVKVRTEPPGAADPGRRRVGRARSAV